MLAITFVVFSEKPKSINMESYKLDLNVAHISHTIKPLANINNIYLKHILLKVTRRTTILRESEAENAHAFKTPLASVKLNKIFGNSY